MAQHEIRLCPVCGERLTVQEKTNTTGDALARRTCSVTNDYTEPWQHRPAAAAAVGSSGFGHDLPTAVGEPRQAPLGIHEIKAV